MMQKDLTEDFYDLGTADFLPKQSGYVNRRKLAGTEGYQMLITSETKALINPIAAKRVYDVCINYAIEFSICLNIFLC